MERHPGLLVEDLGNHTGRTVMQRLTITIDYDDNVRLDEVLIAEFIEDNFPIRNIDVSLTEIDMSDPTLPMGPNGNSRID